MEVAMDRGTDDATEQAPETSAEQEHVHPLDEEPTRPSATETDPVARRRRGLGANRHLGSVVLSFLAVLAAYGAIDFGFARAQSAVDAGLPDSALADRTVIALVVAAACLFVAAAAGRISGLGPLLAGLVLGAAPTAWVLLDFASYLHRLDDVPEIWDHTTFGLVYVSFAVFPAVAGLLVGAAVAGRWRRPA